MTNHYYSLFGLEAQSPTLSDQVQLPYLRRVWAAPQKPVRFYSALQIEEMANLCKFDHLSKAGHLEHRNDTDVAQR